MSATLPMKPIQVGLLGAGTVGSGTFKVLKRNQEEIKRRAGRGIEIAMVADLDTARAREVAGEGVKVVSDAREGRVIRVRADYAQMNALIGYLTENCCAGPPCGPEAACPPKPKPARRMKHAP